jgi:hypothetical protein
MEYINKIKQVKMSFYKAIHLFYYFPTEDNIMESNDLLTIKEAANLYRVHITTIYKAIQEGRIEVELNSNRKKKIKKVKKSDLEREFANSNRNRIEVELNSNRSIIENYSTSNRNRIEVESIKTAVKEVIEAERSQLMKPLEEQALYRLGRIEQENQFLKQRLETVLQENELFKEQLKALPLPAELELKEHTILLIQKEKADVEFMLSSLQKEKESNQKVLMENANNLKELSSEKAKIEIQLKEQNSTIKEKEHSLKELHELHNQEIERLKLQAEEEKNRLKSEAEEREKHIAEAWKKELELAKKPWWKFW